MTGSVWNLTLFGTAAVLSYLLTFHYFGLRLSEILKRWLALVLPACSVRHHRGHHSLHVLPLRLTRRCCRSSARSSPRLPPVVWPPSWLSSPPWSSSASPPCAGSGSAAPPASASPWLPWPRLLQWTFVTRGDQSWTYFVTLRHININMNRKVWIATLTKYWRLFLTTLGALRALSFMVVMMVVMVVLGRSAASGTPSIRLVLSAEQIVKNVNDGCDVSLGLTILVLQGRIQSSWRIIFSKQN